VTATCEKGDRVAEERSLSVTEAMTLARGALEGLSLLRVIGEVSELTDRPGYKAVYFTMGDGSSVMSCLLWRDAYAASGVQLRPGMLVEVTGSLTVYPPKGRLQFQVRSVAPAGEGVLRMQVAALARRLEAEGLMRPERKRELPAYPERIGLVTSPRGKAVHDVIRTLRRRHPGAELVIAGVAVEGADAASSICAGIDAARAADVDVLIVARGGGSYEDLMPFNTELVARAIAACRMPVVTGIGHEPDTTIADMVADVRASTPTAAAESVACAFTELEAHVGHLARSLGRGLQHVVQTASHRVALLGDRAVFRDPDALLGVPAQQLDAEAEALGRALPERLARDAVRVLAGASGLRRIAVRVGRAERDRLAAQRGAMLRLGPAFVERGQDRLGMEAARLEDLSPLAILGRGYAVCYDASGTHVVRSAEELSSGDRVRVRLGQGRAECTVETVEAEA
jgi:exodeoxyribonuclease VII large subunit